MWLRVIRASPALASPSFCLLIPPFQFHKAIQGLGIIVIIGKAGGVLFILFLAGASRRLVVILEFIVIIVRVP